MFKLAVKQFGLRCSSVFEHPIPYTDAYISDLALKVLTNFRSYGLQATNIKKIEGDRLFRYSISFSMFNGNAQFDCDSERVLIEIFNGQNAEDGTLIEELLAKAHKCLPSPDKALHVMTAHCHCEFSDGQKSDAFFGQLRPMSDKVKFVKVTVETSDNAELLKPLTERILLDVEPSQLLQGGLFLAWRFNTRGMMDEQYYLKVNQELKSLAGKLDIELTSYDRR